MAASQLAPSRIVESSAAAQRTAPEEPTMLPIAFRVLSHGASPKASADCSVHMARVVRLEAPASAMTGARPTTPRAAGSRLSRSMALRDLLIERATFVSVDAGAGCGDATDDTLVVVVSGEVEVRIGACADAVFVVRKGEAFGFVPAPRTDAHTTFVARGAVRLARVRAADVHGALLARPELATQIAAAARGWVDAIAKLPAYRTRQTTETRDGSWVWTGRAEPERVTASEPKTHAVPVAIEDEEITAVRKKPAPLRASTSGEPTDRTNAWDAAEVERLDQETVAAMRPIQRVKLGALWAAILSGPAVVVFLLATQIPLSQPPASLDVQSTVARVALRAEGSPADRARGVLPLVAPMMDRADEAHATPRLRGTPSRRATPRAAHEAARAASAARRSDLATR